MDSRTQIILPQAQSPTVSKKLPEMSLAVQASMQYCTQITKQHAKNFYYGLKLTPEPKRSAIYVIYAFMRACDDLVDQPVEGPDAHEPLTVEQGTKRIEAFREAMTNVLDTKQLPEQESRQSVWPAFEYVANCYQLNTDHLHAMLDGQKKDLVDHAYQTFDQLYDYCYQVASVVGLVCVSIWGTQLEDPAVVKLAEYRGIAFQLTNILRDVQEDVQRGRVYLPADELAEFGVDPEIFAAGEPNKNFDQLMAFQIDRAQKYFDLSADLEKLIMPDCQSTSWAMCRIYRGILNKIQADPRRVLRGRVSLTKWQKTCIALTAKWRQPIVNTSV